MMMAELGENEPVHCLLPYIRNEQIPKQLGDSVWRWERERVKIVLFPSQSCTLFLIDLPNARDRKSLILYIVDPSCRETWLPILARVLLCLVRVGVTWVSWAVRYLDKPWWRAEGPSWVNSEKLFKNSVCRIIWSCSNWKYMTWHDMWHLTPDI